MKVWKTIPSWFRLANYDRSVNFDAEKWYLEIVNRVVEPVKFEDKIESIEYIKNYTFFSNNQSEYISTKDMTNDEAELEIRLFDVFTSNAVSVKELNESTAYDFFLGSDKKEEIEKDFAELVDDYESESVLSGIKRRNRTLDKYRGPIAKTNIYNEDEELRFLEVHMRASDEKILKDFKTWLQKSRIDMGCEFLKHEFSSFDFEDWYESRLLPYWDLTKIAKQEDATIPFHILGAALFPDEYEVDLAERVRKVTKRKCQQIFSWAVVEVLKRQTASNYLKEAQHILKKAE